MKPRILAMDTTSGSGSFALIEGTETVEEAVVHAPDGFAHILFAELEKLLKGHGWELNEIDCFAAAAGPGSFTGVRVGMAAVKGLAESLGRPVVAVSNLEAIAGFASAPIRAPFLEARAGEVYGGCYSDLGVPLQPEIAGLMREWLEKLPGGAELVSPHASRFGELKAVQAPSELAAAIGRIAAGRLATGRALDPLIAVANYVRRSDAELFWTGP
jgi:tRNA threonylcarbamoyladenosine biosynthesis protein TsaB